MELMQLPEWLMWIREIPWFLFAPFAIMASIVVAYITATLIVKWLQLAFGFKDIEDCEDE